MKILELTGEPIGTGGQEMFIINVLRHIDLTDLQIDWLTPYYCENDTYRKEIEDRGGKVICFDLRFNPGGSRNNIVKPLHKFLKENHYDVIHIHSGSTSILALCALVAKWNKVKKVIVHSYCTSLAKTWKYYFLKMLTTPFFMTCPTDFLACSGDAGQWKFSSSIVSKKLQVVKNGIDLDRFHPDDSIRKAFRAKLGISDDTIVIGHVGRFSFQKNQEFLVDALSLLIQRGSKSVLMFIGVGETMNEIKSIVHDKNLDNKIFFIGSVSNVNDYMQAMDIFAFPSRWEGLGIVGIEAQAIGIPLIASTKVPLEMKLIADVEFLSLDNIDTWVDCLDREVLKLRVDNTEIIRECGYDIELTAKNIRTLYTQN